MWRRVGDLRGCSHALGSRMGDPVLQGRGGVSPVFHRRPVAEREHAEFAPRSAEHACAAGDRRAVRQQVEVSAGDRRGFDGLLPRGSLHCGGIDRGQKDRGLVRNALYSLGPPQSLGARVNRGVLALVFVVFARGRARIAPTADERVDRCISQASALRQRPSARSRRAGVGH